jgi:hypothetical protein
MVLEIIGQIGGPSLIAAAVLMVLTGRLVPRRVMQDAIKDRDEWRAAYMASEQARHLEASHTGELLEAARTSVAVLQALTPGSTAVNANGIPTEAGRNAIPHP